MARIEYGLAPGYLPCPERIEIEISQNLIFGARLPECPWHCQHPMNLHETRLTSGEKLEKPEIIVDGERNEVALVTEAVAILGQCPEIYGHWRGYCCKMS